MIMERLAIGLSSSLGMIWSASWVQDVFLTRIGLLRFVITRGKVMIYLESVTEDRLSSNQHIQFSLLWLCKLCLGVFLESLR